MLESKDTDPVELSRQKTRACADSGRWNHKHKDTLGDHPAITMFQEHQLHPLITVWPELAVIRWIEIQKRAGFCQHTALKRAAVNRRDPFRGGRCSPVRIEFNASGARAAVFGDFDQGRTVTEAGIDGCIRPGRNQECPNVLGFIDWQGIIAELEAAGVAHRSS